MQFVWQFPHFWAIAWVADEDYKKAGFHMLPSPKGRDTSSALQIFVFTLFVIPVGLMPFWFGMSGIVSAIVISLAGLYFCWQAWQLMTQCTVKTALRLMFGSFLYLPVIQLAVMLGF
jgi:protoheme IX farnesyltransferase